MRTSDRKTRPRGARVAAVLGAAVLAASAGAAEEATMADTLTLTSPAFADGEDIPRKYTCEGEDTTFPLAWSGVPEGTKSLALTIFDPDAPRPQGWIHWAVYDLPADLRAVPEGGKLPDTAKFVRNDFDRDAYGGPCPPPGHGVHHYRITLYALDTAKLDTPKSYDDLVSEAKEHALATAELTGTYERKKK